MKIIVNNNAGLSNKYVRFIKWKMYNLKEKFDELLYVKLFLNKEGNSPTEYLSNMILGLPGRDLILKNKSDDIWKLLYDADRNARLRLAVMKRNKI
ncbi:MAG: hypothetical protein R2788_10260 [Saprospiraceae bacterium]|jgi:hypothetical protein